MTTTEFGRNLLIAIRRAKIEKEISFNERFKEEYLMDAERADEDMKDNYYYMSSEYGYKVKRLRNILKEYLS